jgi:hypothetical protein
LSRSDPRSCGLCEREEEERIVQSHPLLEDARGGVDFHFEGNGGRSGRKDGFFVVHEMISGGLVAFARP